MSKLITKNDLKGIFDEILPPTTSDNYLSNEDFAWLDFQDSQAYSTAISANSSAEVNFYMDEEYYSSADISKYNTTDYRFILAEVVLYETTNSAGTAYTSNTPLILKGHKFFNYNGQTQLRLYVYNPTSASHSLSRLNTIVNVLAIKKSKVIDPAIY